jgi:tRNA pseudouridine38-40 synthase
MVHFKGVLDIKKMKKGASLFEGEHNFKNYCYKPNENTKSVRTVFKSIIKENGEHQPYFFPKESWVFEVESSGFLRHQVRLMMGALIRLGQGELSLEDISKSLNDKTDQRESLIVPSSGLTLNKVEFF